MTRKKFEALSRDEQIDTLARQGWRQRRKLVRAKYELECIDVQELSPERREKYLRLWESCTTDIEKSGFFEWLSSRVDRRVITFGDLKNIGQRAEQWWPEWQTMPDSIKAKMFSKSLERPNEIADILAAAYETTHESTSKLGSLPN